MTRRSILVRLRDGNDADRSEAFRVLTAGYWQPISTYIRLAHRRDPDAADDLTQSFFGAAWIKSFFSSYDPERARFRTFLRLCVDRFVLRQAAAERTLKRGGETILTSLEAGNEHPDPADPIDQDVRFHQEFVRNLFTRSVDRLQRELEGRGKHVTFALFDRYDLDSAADASYASLAAEFGLSESTVTNQLHAARRRFREIVLDDLRELAVTEEEFRVDAAQILGIEAP
ncbi:MAG: sigma-70 family RNA polymerase sigma factor [Gemmatimonadales bacterium]|nr:sigma-70 family RNA polymerase sigma factor [Gemmatimonadales bacterium]